MFNKFIQDTLGPASFSVSYPKINSFLYPNKKVHWAKKAKETKKSRYQSRLLTAHSIDKDTKSIQVQKRFCIIQRSYFFKINRNRDIDNFDASTKSINDGITDSKLIIDDNSSFLYWLPSSIIVDKSIKSDYVLYDFWIITQDDKDNLF